MTPEELIANEDAPLSAAEHDMLLTCEQTIETHQAGFIETASALVTVRDLRLFRETYPTFDAYCKERWNFGRSHAYRLIAAGEVAENVPVETERQARELVGLPKEIQEAAYFIASEVAPKDGDGKPIVNAPLLKATRVKLEEELANVLHGHIGDAAGETKPLSVVVQANAVRDLREQMLKDKEDIRNLLDRRTRKAHADGDAKAVPAQPAPLFLMYTLRECVRALERERQDKGKLPSRLFNAFHFAKSVIGEPDEGSEISLLPDALEIDGECERCGHGDKVKETVLTVNAENHVRSLRIKLCDFCLDVYQKIVTITPNGEVAA